MTDLNPLILSVNILEGKLKTGDVITVLEPHLSTRKPTNDFHYRTHRLGVIARRTIRNDEVNTKNIAIALTRSPDASETLLPILSQLVKSDRILTSNGLHYLRIRRTETNANGKKYYTFSNLVPIRITLRDNELMIVQPQ